MDPRSPAPDNDMTPTPSTIGATADRVLQRLPKLPTPEQLEQRRQQEEQQQERQRQTEAARRTNRLEMDLGKRYARSRCSLDNYTVYAKGQEEALARLRQVAASWPATIQAGHGLILMGPVGSGKDHLLSALLYQAAAEHPFLCRWIGGQELFGRFRDQMHDERPEHKQLADLAEADVLAISDPIPPSCDLTRWSLDQLYRLIDRRYRAMRPTWATVNVASVAEADAKLSAPIFDRLRENATVVRCFWPSFRERMKAEQ